MLSTSRTRRFAAALAVGASVLLVSTGCGFNNATDQIYTQADGQNDRSGELDFLNVLIVSTEANSGSVVASFSNNSTTETFTVDAVGGAVQASTFEPIEVGPGDFVNLADSESQGPIEVTGEFAAGDSVDVTMTYGDQQVDLQVPVVENAGYYAGLDGPPKPTPTETEDEGGELSEEGSH